MTERKKPDVRDDLANLWIPDPAVARRFGYPAGFVPVPISQHKGLIDSGEAQDPAVGALQLREILPEKPAEKPAEGTVQPVPGKPGTYKTRAMSPAKK